MSGVQLSRTFKLSQLRLRLINIVIHMTEGNSEVEWKTVTILTNITGKTW